MKIRRQGQILEIIARQEVENQKQLLDLLEAAGVPATQATVSRDVKELRLVKALGASGNYRYVTAGNAGSYQVSRFNALFADAVDSVDRGQNVVCVKCSGGMAQAVCAVMDTIQWGGVVGTLAGEDTIFILCRSESAAASVQAEFTNILLKG